MAGIAGITIKKDTFINLLRKRFGMDFLYSLKDPQPSLMSVEEANGYLTSNMVLVNKVEFENLTDIFGKASGAGVLIDMKDWLETMKDDSRGEDPVYYQMYASSSPNEAHLVLSGESHMSFDYQSKPFPKHWGVPPNAQMKGHDGIMRELPGGYGHGNKPIEKWVASKLQHDTKAQTNERGVKPYPFGNYSL